MFRKALLLLAALVFAVGAHLRPCWDFEVAGARVGIGCGLAAARRAELAARACAEELLPGEAALPRLRGHVSLCLRRPGDDGAALADALLRATPGLAVCDGVYVAGRRLGCVEDGAAFEALLRRHIANTLPTWASSGALSRELLLERQYTRAGAATAAEDMLLLVTGLAPVFYFDGNGRIEAA